MKRKAKLTRHITIVDSDEIAVKLDKRNSLIFLDKVGREYLFCVKKLHKKGKYSGIYLQRNEFEWKN